MASNLQRLFGGSPGSVIVKLIFLSLLVGATMSMLGLTPAGLLNQGLALVRALGDLGIDAFGAAGRWLFYGAAVVVPIWLVLRLLNGFR